MNRVLIAGASGFLGKNLVNYIENSNLSVYQLSLRNLEWEKNIAFAEVIINLVGKAHDHKRQASEADFFEINYELTKKLYNYFINSAASLFIHVSSIAALEEEGTMNVVSEEYIPNPKSAYGRSKRKAEEFLISQLLPQGKRLIILRPTMIHGPGDKGNLMLLFKAINKKIPYPLGAFNNKRSFLSIDNICFIIHNIIHKGETVDSGIYNISDDEPLSTLQIINTIAAITEKRAIIFNVPKNIIHIIAKAGTILKLPLNSKTLTKMTSDLVVSNQKIKTALGIQSLPVTAQQGLEKTIKSFLK